MVWLAARHRADRISESLRETIEETTPNRLAYFDEQAFNLFPIVIPERALRLRDFRIHLDTSDFELSWESRFAALYRLESSTNLDEWTVVKTDIASQGDITELTEVLPDATDRIFFRIRENGGD